MASHTDENPEPGMPSVPGVEHRWITVDGVRLHVALSGPADAVPIVLLHGFAQHWFVWRHVIADLATDHRVICLDLRGSGWSDAPSAGYDDATRSADIRGLLDALGIARARVVGHGWGGWLAMLFALEHPCRVHDVLALNSHHPWLDRRQLRHEARRFLWTTVIELPVLGTLMLRRHRVQRWLLRRGTPGPSVRDAAATAVFTGIGRRPEQARAAQQLAWRFALDELPRLRSGRYADRPLTVPLALLTGGRDRTMSTSALDRAPAGAVAGVVAGAGHYLPEERPDVVLAALRHSHHSQSVPHS